MKKTTLLLYSIVFTLFWLMTYFTAIDIGDDIAYMFVFGENNHPIHSVVDCIVSQYNHYFVQHGRIPVMFLVQLFDSVIGKTIFNVCNALLFCFTLYLLVQYTFHKQSVFYVSLSLFLIFFFLPEFGGTHLWLTGSIDYLWASTFYLLFFVFFRRYSHSPSSFHLLWLCPYSLITGMCHEAFSLSISFGLLVCLFLERNRLLRSSIVPISISFMIGTALLALAPGTLRRTQMENGVDLMYFLRRLIPGLYSLFLSLRLFWLFILLYFIRFRENKDAAIKFAYSHVLELSALLISPMILFVASRYGGRICYATEVFALIMILHLIATIDMSNYSRYLSPVLLLVLISAYLYIIPVLYEDHKNDSYIKEQLHNKNQLIRVPQIKHVNPFEERYLHSIVAFGPGSYYFALSPNNLIMRYTSIIYGISDVVFIPEEIYSYCEDCMKSGKKLEKFVTKEDWCYYVKEVPSQLPVKDAELILEETNYAVLPFYTRLMAPYLSRYRDMKVPARSAVVKMLGNYYLFVEKSLPEVNERIVGIKVKYDSI